MQNTLILNELRLATVQISSCNMHGRKTRHCRNKEDNNTKAKQQTFGVLFFTYNRKYLWIKLT